MQLLLSPGGCNQYSQFRKFFTHKIPLFDIEKIIYKWLRRLYNLEIENPTISFFEVVVMENTLTSGSPMKLILRFSFPILLGMLFQQFYNLVDTIIVGQLLGANALAAVGSTGAINFLVLGFCMGICSGFSIPVAQKIGAKDNSSMRRYVMNGVYLSAIFTLVITVVTAVFCEDFLRLTQTPEDIFVDAYRYIFIIFLGIPGSILYNYLSSIIRALGDSKTPVYFLALSAFLNIFLDIALILWFQAGVAGAAIATIASQLIAGIACLFFMIKRFPILKTTKDERKISGHHCIRLCYIGIPMGLQYSITAIGSIILQTAINTLGSTYVAAVTAGGKLFQLLCAPMDSLGSTMAIYSGQNAGAAEFGRLRRGLLDSSLLGLVYSVFAYVLMYFFSRQGAMLFLNPQEPNLQQLIELVDRYILILTAFFFPLSLILGLRFSIQGMGFSVLAMSAGLMELVGRAIVAMGFVPIFGYDAACYASPVAWVMADLFLIPGSILCVRTLEKRHKEKNSLS